MTELVQYQPPSVLSEQMEFARAVSDGSLLPDSYRGKPANVLIAVGLGTAMGLSPAESLYRIDVIQGKPTASAELIAANVRKAGHKLRVQGDEQSCTATIIRRDDPDFPFTITRDLAWAQRMGLTTKSNYKSQPGTMLQWRAISAVARLACPEALYGVAYTPDEMWDDQPTTERVTVEPTAPAASRMAAMLGSTQAGDSGEAATAAVVPPLASDDRSDLPVRGDGPPESPLLNTRGALAKRMFATLNEVGISDDERIDFCSATIGRTITSSKEMTDADAELVIAAAAALRVDAVTDVELPDPTTDETWGQG